MSEADCAFFICQGKCIGIKVVKKVERKDYYLFDPSSNNDLGKPCANGAACLIKFETFQLMCQHIEIVFKKKGKLLFEIVPCSAEYGGGISSLDNHIERDSIPNVGVKMKRFGGGRKAKENTKLSMDCRRRDIVGGSTKSGKRLCDSEGVSEVAKPEATSRSYWK